MDYINDSAFLTSDITLFMKKGLRSAVCVENPEMSGNRQKVREASAKNLARKNCIVYCYIWGLISTVAGHALPVLSILLVKS